MWVASTDWKTLMKSLSFSRGGQSAPRIRSRAFQEISKQHRLPRISVSPCNVQSASRKVAELETSWPHPIEIKGPGRSPTPWPVDRRRRPAPVASGPRPRWRSRCAWATPGWPGATFWRPAEVQKALIRWGGDGEMGSQWPRWLRHAKDS